MRLALAAFAHERATPPSFRVFSGTASGSDVPKLLGSGVPYDVTYRATTVPDSAIDCAYLYFLRSRLGVPVLADHKLESVATLREAGTEFGATGRSAADVPGSCGLQAAVSLSFPVDIAFLRDAYDDLDQSEANVRAAKGLARATSLEASLAEPRQPLNFEANPSPKTRAVMDVTLAAVLAEISHRGIRHVGIHATNIGDAIFLARKIRDVAPDVRLAFFESDALLLHPQYRPALLGSLVLSPYPFLGVSDFSAGSAVAGSSPGSASYGGFVSAVLAQRNVAHSRLYDYTFDVEKTPLPIWVSTIGRSGLVPRDVKRAVDCSVTVYGAKDSAMLRELCAPKGDPRTWARWNTLRTARLPIDPNVLLPRLWHFLFVALLLGFVIDQSLQGKAVRRMAQDGMPAQMVASADRAADRAIGRTKGGL
jgi:hypothetical protein